MATIHGDVHVGGYKVPGIVFSETKFKSDHPK
jgi:hypothetical protein